MTQLMANVLENASFSPRPHILNIVATLSSISPLIVSRITLGNFRPPMKPRLFVRIDCCSLSRSISSKILKLSKELTGRCGSLLAILFVIGDDLRNIFRRSRKSSFCDSSCVMIISVLEFRLARASLMLDNCCCWESSVGKVGNQ